MLSGVLNGVMKQAPVLVLDKSDVKVVHRFNSHMARPVIGSRFKLLEDEVIELIAWRKRVMVFVYIDPETGPRGPTFSGPIQAGYRREGEDLAALVEAAKTGDVYFAARGLNDSYPDDYFRVRLTPAGKTALSVWLDAVLEQM